jgi:acetyltransferase
LARSLAKLFDPKTIAIIGASDEVGALGYILTQNLLNGGFQGTIYPIHPTLDAILGIKVYASLANIPQNIDLALIAVPAEQVPSVMEACGVAGIKGAIIHSSGFRTAGTAGKPLIAATLAAAHRYNIRVLGANSFGFLNPHKKINASFSAFQPRAGKIAFISQSKAICTAILNWAEVQNVGFSHFISVGSLLDVNFSDLIDFLGTDHRTSSILIYMESLLDARRFMSAAKAFSRNKPIIILKAGKSKAGAQLVFDTGGLQAGNDEVFNAAFKRTGIVRVQTIEQLFDCAEALAMPRRPHGNRLTIVTNASAPGILAADHLLQHGGAMPNFSEKTLQILASYQAKSGQIVDLLEDATSEAFRTAIDATLRDENSDCVLVIIAPQFATNVEKIATELIEISKKHRKTMLVSCIGEHLLHPNRAFFRKNDIPSYYFPESAVDCFLSMYEYSRNIELLYETPSSIPTEFHPNKTKIRDIIALALRENRIVLTEKELKTLLDGYDIATQKVIRADSMKKALEIAEKIGYPVALKQELSENNIFEVKTNIKTPEKLQKTILKYGEPTKQIPYWLEKVTNAHVELFMSVEMDAIFGTVIYFGRGGAVKEIFNDKSIGLPPLNMALAQRIIEDTRIYKYLKTNYKPALLEAIAFTLCKLSYLVVDCPEIKHFSMNLDVSNDHCTVTKSEILLHEAFEKSYRSYPHLVISPYPEEFIKTILLKNGKNVLLRPIRPEDEAMHAEMIANFSEQTHYYRFFSTGLKVNHDFLTRFTQIDYDREIAIVAEVQEKKKRMLAGVVRIVGDPYNETAEYAIAIADPWQGLGLGNFLTDFILEIARKRGFQKIYASLLRGNNKMQHLFERNGFRIRPDDVDTFYAEVEL